MPDDLTRWLMADVFGEVSAIPDAPPWFAEAACYGSSVDFVEPGSKAAQAAALDLCERCTVREACGAYADVEGFVFGIWGGATEKARQAARRDDRAA